MRTGRGTGCKDGRVIKSNVAHARYLHSKGFPVPAGVCRHGGLKHVTVGRQRTGCRVCGI